MPPDPLARYVHWMRVRGISDGLVRRRASFLRSAERAIGKPLLQATHDDVARLLDRQRRDGLSDSTRYVYSGHLRTFYNWAMSHGEMRHRANPVDAAPVPHRPRYLPRPIAVDDLLLAITTATGRVRIILMLAALGGLRAVEIARLRREDVLDRLDEPSLLVHGKGDKPRVVPLSTLLFAELLTYGLPRRGPVIRRLDGLPGPVSPSLISSAANAHLHDAGIPDTLHSLRHFTGTSLYQDTKDIRLVGDILGHDSLSSTAIYAAWDRRDAPEAMTRLAERLSLKPLTARPAS